MKRTLLLWMILGTQQGLFAQHSLLENLVFRSTRHAATMFCKIQHPESLTKREAQKQETFLDAPNAAVAVMFWEFIEGKGPEWRYLHGGMPYVQAFKWSPGWKEVCLMLKDHQNLEQGKVIHLRYQFSANVFPFRPSTWRFAAEQNIRTLRSGHLEQFFLGSFDVWASKENDSLWKFTVYNRTSRRSLYFGMVPRVKRPLRLGTIHQVLVFTMGRNEMEEWLEKEKGAERPL